MTPRARKYTVAGAIIAALLLGHILERYVGWDEAFMVIGGATVAICGAWLVATILERRR